MLLVFQMKMNVRETTHAKMEGRAKTKMEHTSVYAQMELQGLTVR